MYVHTSYVLIKPPMPYITSSRCKRLHDFRPVEILLHKRTNPSPPPCNVLKNVSFIFFKSNHFMFLRPDKNLLRERGCPRVPPCKPLQKHVFKIYDVKHFINFFQKKSLHRALNFFYLWWKSLHKLFFLKKNHFDTYVCMYVCMFVSCMYVCIYIRTYKLRPN